MEITKYITSERDRALIGGDYAAYHAQATRRIQALRKRLGAATPRGRKFTQKPVVTAEDVAKNSQWIYLLLASAERAWADAMHMKTSQSPENTQKPLSGATKRQIVSRFRTAILYATNLVNVVQDQAATSATNQDLLEAKAYLFLLRGGLDFEKSRWADCISNYAFVHLVYSTLSQQSTDDVFKDLLDGTVEPSIRYAGHQQKLPRTKAVRDIAIEHFPQSESSSRQTISDLDITAFETNAEKVAAQAKGAGDLPSTIEWRGRTVKLEDASISQALAIADQKAASLTETATAFHEDKITAKDLAEAYDQVIDASQEAANATKTAIDELLAEGVSQSDNRVQSLQVGRTAINYQVIEWQVGRNRVLCGANDGLLFEPSKSKRSKKQQQEEPKSTKDEPTGRKLARLRERAALYDSILQSIDAVKQLPGVAADTDFIKELDSKRSYFRSLKCIAVGRSHAINSNVANALGLFARALEVSKSVQQSVESAPIIPRLEIDQAQLTALRSHVESLTLRFRALTELNNISHSQANQSAAKVHKLALIHRLYLNQYDDEVDLQNIVSYPPKVEPIPMQPLILDLAYDYIQYTGHEQQAPAAATNVSKQETSAEEPKKRGWFGFGR